MFTKIMAPVDLSHVDRLGRALGVAADLACHYDIAVVYVAVTAPTPGPHGHTPEEFAQTLAAFAADQAAQHGHRAEAHAMVTPDPAIDLDGTLLEARHQIGADLVVVASHVPGATGYLFPSHGGKLASHSKVSVMVVREEG
ncbi:universal stress protein [Actibacterium sp. XHP0104]|uniref:universal stress protein n=1 Tax=Actibacterium sp. XHP0104 TaxID=2984335 RepID=UPI0021E7DDF0|nr:universal stress protein [Actibacterium sp. XHP0104]MCV2880950.1 universal stress protein [Actibacterium sp. XHP0104]